MQTRSIGFLAESAACRYLVEHGFRIVKRNWTCRWGELDIIAAKDKLYFFEVKFRRSVRYGSACDYVTAKKLKTLRRAIDRYLYLNKLTDAPWQLDVLGIQLKYRKLCIKRYQNVLGFL